MCVPGSPGQLSPGASSIAPTIPTAPHSPRDLDSFDFDTPFDFTFSPSLSLGASYDALSAAAYPATHGLTQQQQQRHQRRGGGGGCQATPTTPLSAPPLHRHHASPRYGSLDHGLSDNAAAYERALASRRQQTTTSPYDDVMSRSTPSSAYGASSMSQQQHQRPHSSSSAHAPKQQQQQQQHNTLQDQLDYVTSRSSSRDRRDFQRDPHNFERPKTTPPSLDARAYSSGHRSAGGASDVISFSNAYAGLNKEDFYPTNLKQPQQQQQQQQRNMASPSSQQSRAGAVDVTRHQASSSPLSSSSAGAQQRYPM